MPSLAMSEAKTGAGSSDRTRKIAWKKLSSISRSAKSTMRSKSTATTTTWKVPCTRCSEAKGTQKFNLYQCTADIWCRKKRGFVLPFTKQYFHLRDLQKAGKTPQFGSYKYSAQHFYDKGILLSIDQQSPRQFDKIDIVLSSNEVGVFTIEIFNNALGITNRVAHADVKMEDLLQAQFENKASYSLFNGLAKFNLNLLLWQINKK